MKYKTELKYKGESLWPYYFLIDEEVTKALSSEDHKRIVCKINNLETINCALMPLGRGSYLMVNQEVRKKLSLEPGSEVVLEMERDTSKYGMPMPESLQVMLDQDEIGSKYFHQLTPGKQRSLIHLVAKVKSLDKQINKSLAILEHLKDINGNLDYKLLNIKIKEHNNL